MEIRPETPADYATIYRLTRTAFAPMPYSDGNEADCIEKLRADGDLVLSLVAILDGKLAAHVAFSPVFIGGVPGNWYGLGPVSVWPDLQGRGIGKILIEDGLARLRAKHADGCVLIGNPDYYSRFGFISDGGLTYRDLETKFVQWLAFDGARPDGEVTFSPGLE